MARRLVAFGVVKGKGRQGADREHVWRDARGWWTAPVYADPGFARGPFPTRDEAEGRKGGAARG